MSYDEQRLKRQVGEAILDHEPPSAARDPGASDAVPASAPGDDAHPGADAGARDALMHEAVGVGWPEAECRHVVTMHRDLAKAREILTNAARKRIQVASHQARGRARAGPARKARDELEIASTQSHTAGHPALSSYS